MGNVNMAAMSGSQASRKAATARRTYQFFVPQLRSSCLHPAFEAARRISKAPIRRKRALGPKKSKQHSAQHRRTPQRANLQMLPAPRQGSSGAIRIGPWEEQGSEWRGSGPWAHTTAQACPGALPFHIPQWRTHKIDTTSKLFVSNQMWGYSQAGLRC